MRIVLSGNLLRFSAFQREVNVEARTVRDALEALAEAHPSLRPVLFDAAHNVLRAHKLFIDGDSVESLDTPTAAQTELFIVTAIAGG
jgi:sulfur-carrier protein